MSLLTLFSFWGIFLLAQNWAFTYVSRARNSADRKRHIKAAICSNGIWFIGQLFAFTAIYRIITGAMGFWWAIAAAVYYTFFTVLGADFALWYALKTEKGKAAVGASARYAQIPVEDWERVRALLLAHQRALEALAQVTDGMQKEMTGTLTDVRNALKTTTSTLDNLRVESALLRYPKNL